MYNKRDSKFDLKSGKYIGVLTVLDIDTVLLSIKAKINVKVALMNITNFHALIKRSVLIVSRS